MVKITEVTVKRTGERKAKKAGRMRSAGGGGKGRAVMVRPSRPGLDALGAAYMRLLLDPCKSPMVYPTYGGSAGGYLAKFESFVTIPSTPANTNGFLWWSPSTLSNTPRGCLVAGDWPDSSTGLNWTTSTADLTLSFPGYQFLKVSGIVGAYRAVAGCMEVMYNGSESSRQGQLGLGPVSNASLYLGTRSVDQLQTLAESVTRTPVNKVQCTYRPSHAASLSVDATSTLGVQSVERNDGILLTYTNLPAASGFRVRLTLVVEWTPEAGSGYASGPVPLQSRSTLQDVYDAVARSGRSFVEGMREVRDFVRAVSYAVGGGSSPPGRIEL